MAKMHSIYSLICTYSVMTYLFFFLIKRKENTNKKLTYILKLGKTEFALCIHLIMLLISAMASYTLEHSLLWVTSFLLLQINQQDTQKTSFQLSIPYPLRIFTFFLNQSCKLLSQNSLFAKEIPKLSQTSLALPHSLITCTVDSNCE